MRPRRALTVARTSSGNVLELLRYCVQPDLERVEVGLVAVTEIRGLLRSRLDESQHEVNGPGYIGR